MATVFSSYQTLPPNGSCQYYRVMPGTITWYPGNNTDGISSTQVFTETFFYFVDCASSTIPGIIAAYQSAILNMTRTVPFCGSLTPYMAAITSCATASWVLFFIVILTSWKRPIVQKLQVTFLMVYSTFLFASLHYTMRKQHALGYESIDPWLIEYFNTPRVIPLYAAFLVCLVTEGYTLLRLYQLPQVRVFILTVTSLFAVAELVLWIVRMIEGGFNDFKTGELAVSFKAWMGILSASQILFFLGVLWTFRKRERFALAREHWGIALVSVFGCLLSVFTTVLGNVVSWTWQWALLLALLVRSVTAVALWNWRNSVEAQEQRLSQIGVLGRPVYEKVKIEHYSSALSGEEHGHGETTAIWTGAIAKILNWLDYPYAPSLNKVSVKKVDVDRNREASEEQRTEAGPLAGDSRDQSDSSSDNDSFRPMPPAVHPPAQQPSRRVIHYAVVRQKFGPAQSMNVSSLNSTSGTGVGGSVHLSLDMSDPGSGNMSPGAQPSSSAGPGPSQPRTSQPSTEIDDQASTHESIGAPPSFVPHPGFRTQDYYDEKNRRHL